MFFRNNKDKFTYDFDFEYKIPKLKENSNTKYIITFIICVIITCVASWYYLYSSYERENQVAISTEILNNITIPKPQNEEPEPIQVLLQEPEIVVLSDQTETTEVQTIDRYYMANNGIQYEIVGIINIDKLNIQYPILAKTTEELLKVSVCKFYGANPNEIGNCCISGHNYRNNQFFSNIDKLKVDDIIDITDLTGRTISYAVCSKYTVQPDDIDCTSQLTAGKRKITLITCTDNNKKRVIVEAKEIEG